MEPNQGVGSYKLAPPAGKATELPGETELPQQAHQTQQSLQTTTTSDYPMDVSYFAQINRISEDQARAILRFSGSNIDKAQALAELCR